MNPLSVSVVMPTYNRREMLRTSLEGLARQDYPLELFEVVVVSDGSTDGTNEMLKEFVAAGTFPYRLRPIVQENAGPARARNRGIQEATGDIIVFIDDDVEPAPAFLSAHVAHHVKNPKIVAIGPMSPDPARQWQEPCWIAWEHAMLEKQYTAWRTGEWRGVGPNHFYSGNASIRREYLLTVGGFDETFKRQEDVEMAYRLERTCGLRFTFDETALGIHRPDRTFASWKKVPYAYGQLDVVRAQRGDLKWEVLQITYQRRNRITRAFIRLWLTYPPVAQPLEGMLLGAARTLYKLRKPSASFAALSALYNLLYLQGAYTALGSSTQEMRNLLSCTGIYAAENNPA